MPLQSESLPSTLLGAHVKLVISESVLVRAKNPPQTLQPSLLHSLQYQSPMKLNFLNAYQHAAHVTKPLMKKTSTPAEREYSQSMDQLSLVKQLDGTSWDS
jgi:hypothetical protein